MNRLFLLLAVILLSACKDDISATTEPSSTLPPAANNPAAGNCSSNAVSIIALDDKSAFQVEVNASSEDSWVFFDLDNAQEVAEDDAEKVWDIAFQRFLTRSNGGEGGPGNVAVAYTQRAGTTFANTNQPEDDGSVDGSGNYRQDGADPDPEGGNFDGDGHALNSYPEDPNKGGTDPTVDGWPVYNFSNHRISPREETIFTVRASSGEYYKIEFLNYYSSAHGGSGYPQFNYAGHAEGWTTDVVTANSGCDGSAPGSDEDGDGGASPRFPNVDVEQSGDVYTLQVRATEEDEWIYLNLARREQISFPDPVDPAESTDWDIAFMRTGMKLNSGVSGSGNAGAHDVLNGTFGERTGAPEEGAVDTEGGGLIPLLPASVEYHQDEGSTLVMTSQPPQFLPRRRP